ncbi:MAG TPA: Rad52/Rad22 family DNA repair protein [Roseiflexaceae bacterium]|nr:Rad52/Rad22 family DNA repair protein [Roseiflexaceae bacterium]
MPGERPDCAVEVWEALSAPFPPELVELKPGAVAEERQRALALAYVDARHYQARLDAVVGPFGWHVAYRPWGERAVICALTVCGITREDVGEAEKGDPNQATSAAMQAFKRACAAFGLGRYLYTDLPQMWVEAERRGRSWVIVNSAAAVVQMYAEAGIDLHRHSIYVQRIHTLLQALSQDELVAIGRQIAGTARKAA